MMRIRCVRGGAGRRYVHFDWRDSTKTSVWFLGVWFLGPRRSYCFSLHPYLVFRVSDWGSVHGGLLRYIKKRYGLK